MTDAGVYSNCGGAELTARASTPSIPRSAEPPRLRDVFSGRDVE